MYSHLENLTSRMLLCCDLWFYIFEISVIVGYIM
uniref:Uncharacterized protein n=2 Tax=Anguilla anguilla TaxID=7936 RepID=A0A0E9TV87_ANGAN